MSKTNAPNNKLTISEKNISDQVLNKVKKLQANGEIDFPPNYSVSNALKAAWLKILATKDRNDKPALSVVSKESVANALLSMLILGLNVNKNQGYFIVYGKALAFQPSYFGTVATLKRIVDVDPVSEVIREGDIFEYHIEPTTGYKILDKHVQKFDNLDSPIVGAYSIMNYKDKHVLTIMTMKQIQAAWNQGQMKGNSKAHKNFPAEMCKKSVINRAAKIELNSSDDKSLMLETFNKVQELEYTVENEIDQQKQIEESIGKDVVDVKVEKEADKPKGLEATAGVKEKDKPENAEPEEESVFDNFKKSNKAPKF